MPQSSCFAHGAKTYYRPIEATIRWCGLLRHEARILRCLGQRAKPAPKEFPSWPCLHLYAECIFDALVHGELPYGKAGLVTVNARPALDDPELTVRHVDLRTWVSHYYPSEKPPFLFDDIERSLHPAVNLKALGVLFAEREAAKAQLLQLAEQHDALNVQHAALLKDHTKQSAQDGMAREPGPRSETTDLNIIGGLMSLLLGKSPSGAAYSSFHTVEAVIGALVAHHQGRAGLSESTLWNKLTQARRHLEMQH